MYLRVQIHGSPQEIIIVRLMLKEDQTQELAFVVFTTTSPVKHNIVRSIIWKNSKYRISWPIIEWFTSRFYNIS